VRTPEPVAGRQNIDIQTDQFVEELTDKAPKYEIGNQTEFVVERPQTPHQIPLKRGVDAKTLVEDNELFIFDKDVAPILAVLCGKTLEIARMEVLEEEELRVMRQQQSHFTDLNKTELSDAQRMEQMEQRKLQEFERRKALERERKKNKIAAHRKICSRTLAKGYTGDLKASAVGYLQDVGYFTNTFQVEVLEGQVLPWLFDRVEGFVQELSTLDNFGDFFVGGNVDECAAEHKATVRAERDRKEAVKRAIEEAHREKLEEKRRKREAKEAARKAAELKKLRDEVSYRFVAKGEYKESILTNEVQEITGFHIKAGAVGALGGFIGQLGIVLSGAHKKAKALGIKVLQEARIIQNFLFLYIDARMKTDKFTMQVGRAVE
jgi:hypothetical protein